MNTANKYLLFSLLIISNFALPQNEAMKAADKFAQLKEELPTPNTYRTASGAPGHEYWQQKADYKIEVVLDDEKQTISGTEAITYYNNSPDNLDYLWLQLDQNIRKHHSASQKTHTHIFSEKESMRTFRRIHSDFDGGYKILNVTNVKGKPLPFTIVETMMRVDLPKSLKPGNSTVLNIKWWYNINNLAKVGGRSGMEFFEDDSNYVYTIAQFYPRMAFYSDIEGWQNKQFLGRGEFLLTFGDFDVKITVPGDHIVAATGELENASRVLSPQQQNRFKKAKQSDIPIFIVTEEEAVEAEPKRAEGTKTWHFKAKNVRDFAFASSRKFIWDAMGVKFGNRTVMAMSFYPKEGNPLWEKYSTKVVAHTIKTYSNFTFDYPYPQATSVHSFWWMGMEYPMISFNGGRSESDGTYSKRTKYGMLEVVIHEVGHNFFPMIVNSDERQWAWMDEGLNTFLQFLAQNAWEKDFLERRDLDFMRKFMSNNKDSQVPIMTNPESIFHYAENAYSKVTIALNVLRETVLGRELFDYAFRTYANRWKFKNPAPADFFRTMEDASGIDLDWFWRGWFYTIHHVDLALTDIEWFKIDSKEPERDEPTVGDQEPSVPGQLTKMRDAEEMPKRVIDIDSTLLDFYSNYTPPEIIYDDSSEYQEYLDKLSPDQIALINSDKNYYQLRFKNVGGLVMPLVLAFKFEDSETIVERIPAEIWRYNSNEVTKIFAFDKQVKEIVLDPFRELVDSDYSNNSISAPTAFETIEFLTQIKTPPNPMQIANTKKAGEDEKYDNDKIRPEQE